MTTDATIESNRRPATYRPLSVTSLIDDLIRGNDASRARRTRPVQTGFDLIDRVLDGGLRVHDLMLIGGAPGAGKTIASLQMARNIALQGRTAMYVCYEHDGPALLGRLLCLELGDLATYDSAPEIDFLRSVVLEAAAGFRDLREVLATEPLVQQAHANMQSYSDRLWLVRGSGSHTGLRELRALIEEHGEQGTVLFVDYLQKVAVHPEPDSEDEKVTRITEGLKEIALSHNIAAVAIVAADSDGIKSPRLHMHHLRGSSALAYECDVAVIMNDKHKIVSKVHLTYDPVRAETFKHQMVFSIEKNRGGPSLVDVEYRKNFTHFRFESQGGYVAEKLVDGRMYSE